MQKQQMRVVVVAGLLAILVAVSVAAMKMSTNTVIPFISIMQRGHIVDQKLPAADGRQTVLFLQLHVQDRILSFSHPLGDFVKTKNYLRISGPANLDETGPLVADDIPIDTFVEVGPLSAQATRDLTQGLLYIEEIGGEKKLPVVQRGQIVPIKGIRYHAIAKKKFQ